METLNRSLKNQASPCRNITSANTRNTPAAAPTPAPLPIVLALVVTSALASSISSRTSSEAFSDASETIWPSDFSVSGGVLIGCPAI